MQRAKLRGDDSEMSLMAPFLLGMAAIVVCGIPFIPPLTFLAWLLIACSLFLVYRAIKQGIVRLGWSLVAVTLTLGIDFLGAYIALPGKHLID